MAGDNVKGRVGPRIAPELQAAQQQRMKEVMAQQQRQQQQPPQQQVVFDTNTIEQLAEICTHYNLAQINVGNIVIVNTRPDSFTAPTASGKKVTDEEILHNPYAGMEQ